MDLFKRNIGRRQFISASSMVLGASMIARPSLLFAANGPSQAQGAASSDGTKYGKNFVFAVKSEPTERGIQMFPMGSGITTEGFSGIIIGRMPPPGPMPSHDSYEKHDGEIEYLIHLGNNPDDPLDLGAEADFYMARGEWREKYEITRSTAVYLPDGMWHCPWKIKKIDTEMTWVNVRIGESSGGGMPGGAPPGAGGGAPGGPGGEGGAPGGPGGGGADPMMSQEALSEEELAKAKTSNYLFDRYMLSGVKDMPDPEGGKWIAYTDCTKIAGGALTRIIRYNPEKAPYSIINGQTHEYPSLFIFLGTDLKDCTDLGAEIELSIGPEKEKHKINKTCYLYVPAETAHGPFKVTKASKPFNFLEIVAGPELPGAVYG